MDEPMEPMAPIEAMPPHPDAAIARTEPEPDAATAELVKDWLKRIEEAETFWKDTFDEMRADAKFAAGKQWEGAVEMKKDDRYVANVTLRHINQRVASIYAKNPKVVAKRRQKMYYKAWDGTQEMMLAAINTIQPQPSALPQPGMPPAPPPPTLDQETAKQVLVDYEEGRAKRTLYGKLARSLELVAQYSLDEPIPKFKTQAKQLVRRVLTCKVGYIKLGYQRYMQANPDLDAKIKDASDRLNHLEALMMDLQEGELEPTSKEAAELKLNLKALMQQKDLLLREGVMFGFPKSWNIIVDPAVTQLKGFVGAGWVAEKFLFTPRQVKEIYKVDVQSNYAAQTPQGRRAQIGEATSKLCAVYEVYDLVGQVCFTVLAGYKTFIKEPGEPDVFLEQFHPYYTLSFNDVESDDCVFPPSDVELLRPMQMDRNRAREGLRIHRIANRPAYMGAKSLLGEETKTRLATHADHEYIEHDLPRDTDMSKVIQAKPTIPIEDSLYSTDPQDRDIMLVAGDQSANLGPTSGATATESGIAESARTTSIQSNIDDLDEYLTDVMRGVGQILLLNMSELTVKKIAGEGAVWVSLNREQVAEELCLEIKAGSSGRPNKTAHLTAIEKVMPLAMQVPGAKPKPMLDLLLKEIDEGLELEDFFEEGLPSITAMNHAKATVEGGYGPESAAAGAQGGANAPKPSGSPAQSQNLNPAPGAGPGQGGAPVETLTH